MGHEVEESSEQCVGGGVCSSKVQVQDVHYELGLWKRRSILSSLVGRVQQCQTKTVMILKALYNLVIMIDDVVKPANLTTSTPINKMNTLCLVHPGRSQWSPLAPQESWFPYAEWRVQETSVCNKLHFERPSGMAREGVGAWAMCRKAVEKDQVVSQNYYCTIH